MNPNRMTGLTLIELLIVMAILFILLLVAVPKFKDSTESNKAVSGINAILGDLQLARSEAINRGQIVTLCASTDGATCNTSDWESGWLVFAENSPANNTVDAGETILKVSGPLAKGLTLRTIEFDNSGYIQYRSDGEVRDTSGDGNSDGTFILCGKDKSLTRAKAINVNNIGRISQATDTDASKDDIVNDVKKNNITCP